MPVRMYLQVILEEYAHEIYLNDFQANLSIYH